VYPGTAEIFALPPIISGTRATNFKFGTYIHRVYPSKSLLKIWEKRERWRIPGLPKFLSTPYIIPGTRKAIYELQIWQVYSEGPCEQTPFKNLEVKEAWAYPVIAKI